MKHSIKNLFFVFIVVLFALLFITDYSQAVEYTFLPLPNSYNPDCLQIDNGQVVWQNYTGNNWQIFLYSNNQANQISNGYYNFDPRINNGQVIWTNWDGNIYDYNSQIFLYNGNQTIQLSNSFNNSFPKIGEGKAVWQGRLNKYDQDQIFLFDGNHAAQLTHDNYYKKDFQIDNGQVAWSGSTGPNYQVFLYDGNQANQVFSNSIYYNEDLQIHNGQIAWRSPTNNGWQVFFYNGIQTVQLTSDGYDKTRPKLNNGQVVWSGSDGNNYEIFLYNGTQVVQLTNSDYDNSDFQIDNGQIVWQGYDGSHYQIFFYDGKQVIQLTTGNYDNYCPKISKGQVVWDGYDGDKSQVFLYDGKEIFQLTNRGSVEKADFSGIGFDAVALYTNLMQNGYIDTNGMIQNKFYILGDYSGMELDFIYESKKDQIYTILKQQCVNYDNYGSEINNDQIVWYRYDFDNDTTQVLLAKPQESLVELLDGSDFTSGRTVATDINKLAQQVGMVMQGVVTDGVTRLLLRMEVGDTNPVTFFLEGESNNPETDNGFLQAIENQDSVQKNQSLTIIPVTVDNKNYVFAIYRAPDNFVRQNNTGDLRISERTITIKAQANNQTIATEEIKLRRPPVILVHGLWSGPEMWDGFSAELKNRLSLSNAYANAISYANSVSFETNKDVIKNAISEVKENLRKQSIAMVQVDIVGHSMGGLLARIWAGERDGMYARNNNFYEGDINKLITIDSPHYGSFLADVVIQCIRNSHMIDVDILVATMEMAGFSLTKGAVEDLMTTSVATQNLDSREIAIPVHSIAGEYTGASAEYYTDRNGEVRFVIEGIPSSYFDIHNFLIDKGYGNAIVPIVMYAGSDLVVSVNNQRGGLDIPTSSTANHHHMAAVTQDVVTRLIELLNKDTDSNLFNLGFPLRSR